MNTPREEFEFLKISATGRSDHLSERLLLTLDFLRGHVEDSFAAVGVEFDRDAALMMATLITGLDGLIESAHEDEHHLLADALEEYRDATEGGAAMLYCAALSIQVD